MNSPLTTPSNRAPMTSKIRFLGDEAGEACLLCYFLKLSATSSALLGQLGKLKPYPGATDLALWA